MLLCSVLCCSQSCNRVYVFLLLKRLRPECAPAVCWLQMLSFVISTVFLLAQCPSLFESGWTWLRLWAALRWKTFAPASVYAGFRIKKKKKTSGGKRGVICKDESKSSGPAEAVVPVEAAYPAFIRYVGTALGHGGETCKRTCNEAGNWCGLHPACSSKTSSGAVCGCDNMSVPDPVL